jgi:dihydropteroate synthase
MSTPHLAWHLRGRVLYPIKTPLVLGIVNVTPDSFSDGGLFHATEAAIAQGQRLAQDGADLLDIGGESSRPGASPVGLQEELDRILPVIRELARRVCVPLSVDTYKAEVARQALAAGAHVINDITALRGDSAMAAVVRDYGAGIILMHMQGTPATMQQNPTYKDVHGEVGAFLEERLQAAANVGIACEQVVLDPGVGFGKTTEHNLQLLANLPRLGRLGRPVCLGASRKGFLGQVLGRPVSQRLAGSLAVVCFALAHRAAQAFRVHDVAETRDAIALFARLQQDRASL